MNSQSARPRIRFQLGIRSLFVLVALAAFGVVGYRKLEMRLLSPDELQARLLTANVQKDGRDYVYRNFASTFGSEQLAKPNPANLRYLSGIKEPFSLRIEKGDANPVFQYLRRSNIRELTLFWGNGAPVSDTAANAVGSTRLETLRVGCSAVTYGPSFYSAIDSLHTLREFSTYDASDEQVAAIADSPHLSKVSFWWHDAPPISRQSMQILAELPALETLDLRCPIANGECLERLSKHARLKSVELYSPSEATRSAISKLKDAGISVRIEYRQWCTSRPSVDSIQKFADSGAEHLCVYPNGVISAQDMRRIAGLETLRELTLQGKIEREESLKLLRQSPNLERLTIECGTSPLVRKVMQELDLPGVEVNLKMNKVGR